MTEQIDMTVRLRAIAAAQGKEPFDLLLAGGRVLDVATLELREADVGIVGPMIASVHPHGLFTDARATHDLRDQIIAPGLIDAHVHFESSHMLPHHYASVVVPQGTTTIFCDPHELANVMGIAGVRYAVEATRGLPLRFIVQASSCVPAAPGLEVSGADFQAAEIRELLSWPEVAGLAEVMDMRAVIDAHPRMIAILTEALASGKLIEGHARGLTGPSLQAYLAAGISADHEITSGADALEKLRAGLTVELRGSHDYVLPEVVAALNTLPVIPTSLTVCTDDVFPDYLVEHGGVADVLRRLIRYGLDPVQAIRCATINSAIRLRRDDLGLVAAGRRADLISLTDLASVAIANVYAGGRHVAANGKLLDEPTSPLSPPLANTMRHAPLAVDDFRIHVTGLSNGRARVRTIKGARFTSWGERVVDVRNGYAVCAGRCQRHDDRASAWPHQRQAADRDHRGLGPLARGLCELLLARLAQSDRFRPWGGRDDTRRQSGDRNGRRHCGSKGRRSDGRDRLPGRRNAVARGAGGGGAGPPGGRGCGREGVHLASAVSHLQGARRPEPRLQSRAAPDRPRSD